MFISGLAALWALLSGISSFRTLTDDESKQIPHLRTISLILGIVYMIAFVIECFGIMAATLQRAAMVRIYSFLSILSSLLILGGSLTQTIIHFTMKDELLNLCTTDATGDTVFFGFGFWGPSRKDTLDSNEAANWCKNEWDHDSWSDILALLLEIVLALFFVAITFAYYAQVMDPTSPVNNTRIPPNQTRPAYQPEHYNPPYTTYPPPPGAPPYVDQGFVPPYDANKPPGYAARDGKFEGDHDAKSFGGDHKYGDDEDLKEDPFSDFDGPSRKGVSPGYEERDLTSRPRPGDRDTF